MTKSQETKGKLLWLSIIQGWAILLVVIGHVNGFTYSGTDGEMYPLSAWIHRFCYSFHMPLFMFVSGGLLYFSRLARGWKTPALYADKLKRLALPFVLFTIVGFCIKAVLGRFAKRAMDVSLSALIEAFFDPANGPLSELWFLGTLMWLMLMYPVYKVALKSVWSEIVLLAITLIPFIFGLKIDVDGWLNIKGVTVFAFYFVAGILFFKYDLTRFFQGGLLWTLVATLVYIAVFMIPEVPMVFTAVPGIVMSVGWGVWLSERLPGLFASFRDHSFQIFLIGIFPQMAVELLVWTKMHHQWLQAPYYVVSSLLALLAGWALSRYMSRCPVKWLRWGCGLK